MSTRALRPGDPVLFLSGDASLTGTPRLLTSLVGWVAEHTDHPAQVLLERGGPLLARLEAVAEVRVVGRGEGRSRAETLLVGVDELGRPAVARRGRQAQRRWRRRGLASPGIVWANGAGALRWVDGLPPEVPVVAHVHELAVGLERSLAGLDVPAVLARPTLFVAVSQAVADLLSGPLGVDPGRIVVHHGWVPDITGGDEGVSPADPLLALPPEALHVGGCGTIGWRKGTSLFLALAQAVGPEVAGRPVHWSWLGGGPQRERERAARELAQRGLADRVHLLDERERPDPWFASLDAFALTSREDPFPLVALEAGAAAVPVVAFASGGVVELLADQLATCVSAPLDLEDLAAKLRAVLEDAALRGRLGTALQQRVTRDHVTSVAAPRLWGDVRDRLAGTP